MQYIAAVTEHVVPKDRIINRIEAWNLIQIPANNIILKKRGGLKPREE